MYESKLLTPSLLNSWRWLSICPPGFRDDARKQLSNYLNRVRVIDEATQKRFDRGNRFEKQVQTLCYGHQVHNMMETVDVVAELCKGGLWQRVTKAKLEFPDITFMLYGKKDVDFKDRIIDIKVTDNYKDPNYYTDSYQHKIYLYCDMMNGNSNKSFTYIVSDLKSVYEIDIDIPDPNLLKREVFEIVNGFYEFLKSNKKLMEAYLTKFCR